MNNSRVKALQAASLNLNPGAWAVENQRPISTLLGSCVAVCLYDSTLKLAGMNHFLLPSQTRRDQDRMDTLLAGDASMERLLNQMLTAGCVKNRLTAKVFGGGTIVSTISMAIGERNAHFALQWLEREGIPVVARDILGNFSRRLILDPTTGDAWCRRSQVDQQAARQLIQNEIKLEAGLMKHRDAPAVEIF